jgi:anti-sigma B factor antagonist
MTEQQPPRRELLEGSGSGELASVTATEHGAVLVLAISGEVDISNIDRIAHAIYALPNTEEGLLIDLSDVNYLDSSAVSLLHDLAMRLRSRAQRMIVVSPPQSPPRRILDLTALYVNAPIADTLEAGIKLLSPDGNAPL